MGSALDFGVQSYCFRNFKDNKEVAKKVKEIGVSSIEICAVHANFNDTAGFKDVVKIYKDAGVKVVSLGVQTFKGLDTERDWFECLKIAGAKHISAHFTVDTFQTAVPKVAKLAEEFDVKVGIHLHGGYQFGGSPDVVNHLMALGGDRIGINIDTAWCMQIGPYRGNPVEWVKKNPTKIYGVHYKDFAFEPNGKWNDVIVGTGSLNLPAFVAALEEAKFDGMAVIEYEANPENPVPALKECVAKMRELTVSV
jgi:sugar phosphate isomerase/epimerase